MKQSSNWSSRLLWMIYLALLAVLLPHTVWAFARFESPGAGLLGVPWCIVTACAAAVALEAAIAVLCQEPAKAWTTLNEVGRAITSTLDEADIQRRLVVGTIQLMRFQAGLLYVAKPKAEEPVRQMSVWDGVENATIISALNQVTSPHGSVYRGIPR